MQSIVLLDFKGGIAILVGGCVLLLNVLDIVNTACGEF